MNRPGFRRHLAAINYGLSGGGYTIIQLAADVNDLRRALGYETISLFGGSFASQWSLAVIRLHPQIVARAVLSSVEPLDGFDIPSQVFAAIQRIAFDADRDPRLAAYLPSGGLMTAVREVHERFAKRPIQVTRKPSKIRGFSQPAEGEINTLPEGVVEPREPGSNPLDGLMG